MAQLKILLGSVYAVSHSSGNVEIRSKPAKRFVFKFDSSKQAKDMASWIKDYTPPNVPHKKSFLANYKPEVCLVGFFCC